MHFVYGLGKGPTRGPGASTPLAHADPALGSLLWGTAADGPGATRTPALSGADVAPQGGFLIGLRTEPVHCQ